MPAPTILFVGSDSAASPIDARLEASYLQMAYRGTKLVDYDAYPQTFIEDFPTHVAQHKPDVLHITCHGTQQGLWFRADRNTDQLQLFSEDVLLGMLKYPKDKVVFIDACNSAQIAEMLFQHKDELRIKLAIGHEGNINVAASYLGARAFHSLLSKGGTYKEALDVLRTTVEIVGREDRVRWHVEESFLSRTLVPQPPEIVARFANKQEILPDKNEHVFIEFGAIGFHGRERCVVSLFSDDDELVGGDFSTVESGFPRPSKHVQDAHEFWTNDFSTTGRRDEVWKVDGDFNVFMCYTYNGEYNVVKSTLTSALRKHYFELAIPHSKRVLEDVQETIERISN